MTETFAARETTPFPAGSGEPSPAESDALAGDWAEGLRAPLREHRLPKPRRHGVQAAAPEEAAPSPAVEERGGGELRTEQLDLKSLGALGTLAEPEPPKETAAEVEAPEAWASAEEDQLASVPPPVREAAKEGPKEEEAGKEEVLLLSDAELAEDEETPEAATALHAGPADATATAPALDGGAAPVEAAPAAGSAAEEPAPPAADGAATLAAPSVPGPAIEAAPGPAAGTAPQPEEEHGLSSGGATLPAEPLGELLGPEEIHLVLAAVGAAHEERHPASEAAAHELPAWDAAALDGAFAQAQLPTAPAAPELAMHIEELVPEDVVDPWGAAPAPAPAPAPEWEAALGGDAIDWAPALSPAWDPPAKSAPAPAWDPPAKSAPAPAWDPPAESAPAPAWEPPAKSAPASAWDPPSQAAPKDAPAPAGHDWSDPAAWDAQTVHAVSLPSLLARSSSGREAWSDAPEPDWQLEPAAAASSPPSLGSSESPFAVLPPGASLSGDDENSPEHELAELGPADLEPLPDDEPELLQPLDDSSPGTPSQPLLVPGEHRVAVQTRAGQTRRGILRNADLGAKVLALESGGGSPAEKIAASEVKAIFFMLAPGERVPRGNGIKVSVTLSDGRAIYGEREGLDAREGFFVIPTDASRTNTRRIFVARAAVSELVTG